MSYQPPIELDQADTIMESIENQLCEYVIRAVQEVGITVDKDELLKALAYDRDQYEKGYADGKRDADPVVRCRDCKKGWPAGEVVYCMKPYAAPWSTHKWDWYCADGEQKEDTK